MKTSTKNRLAHLIGDACKRGATHFPGGTLVVQETGHVAADLHGGWCGDDRGPRRLPDHLQAAAQALFGASW